MFRSYKPGAIRVVGKSYVCTVSHAVLRQHQYLGPRAALRRCCRASSFCPCSTLACSSCCLTLDLMGRCCFSFASFALLPACVIWNLLVAVSGVGCNQLVYRMTQVCAEAGWALLVLTLLDVLFEHKLPACCHDSIDMRMPRSLQFHAPLKCRVTCATIVAFAQTPSTAIKSATLTTQPLVCRHGCCSCQYSSTLVGKLGQASFVC